MEKSWEKYEKIATYLLNLFAKNFGLSRVESKQIIKGQSGTNWEIDAKGVREGDKGFIIIECRRYSTSKQSQGKIASLAYCIIDSGADGGIIVSPLELQKGAEKIAHAENIIQVILDVNSTPADFGMKFLDKILVGMHDNISLKDNIVVELIGICKKCGAKYVVSKDEEMCAKCR